MLAYRAFASGRPGFAETQILRVRDALGGKARLKVILETGEIADPTKIRAAANSRSAPAPTS